MNGQQTTLYLDGRLQGSMAFPITDDLSSIGNHPVESYQDKLMSNQRDDVFIFNRDLNSMEIAKVMQAKFPK
jgi:hypothetical protein